MRDVHVMIKSFPVECLSFQKIIITKLELGREELGREESGIIMLHWNHPDADHQTLLQ